MGLGVGVGVRGRVGARGRVIGLGMPAWRP